jgi:hypothetical protein
MATSKQPLFVYSHKSNMNPVSQILTAMSS